MEEVNNNNNVTNSVPDKLVVTGPEDWLCVAKLPLDITDHEFCEILSEFGKVKESFLMVTRKTGSKKGYGFAQFGSSVAGLQARHVLDGQEVRGHKVECDWVKEGTHTIDSLHSKVLYVDNLPTGFRDLVQFRKIFSTVVNPPYCQIAQKNGVLQDWGLVEYTSADQSEETMTKISETILDGVKIRVQYCIPNVHAINIYMNFINNPLDKSHEKKALLDETPSKDVYNQLEALTKQNPSFVQSLNSIMTTNNMKNGLQNTNFLAKAEDNSSGQTSAMLALLLASYLQKPPDGISGLTNLVKQLEAGTPAQDLLRSALSAKDINRPDQRTANDGISGLLSAMTNIVGGNTPQQPLASVKRSHEQVNTKSPQLTNMLYSSFQAKVNKQQGPALIPEPISHQEPTVNIATPVNLPPTSNGVASFPSVLPNASSIASSQYLTSYPNQSTQMTHSPTHFQLNTLPQVLSLPPPPPPPNDPPPADHSWHYYPQPYLMIPPVPTTAWNPSLYMTASNKRKAEDTGPNNPADPDIFKRQKHSSEGSFIQT